MYHGVGRRHTSASRDLVAGIYEVRATSLLGGSRVAAAEAGANGGQGVAVIRQTVNKTVFATSYMTSYMLAIRQVRLLILLGKLASFRSAISLTERQ